MKNLKKFNKISLLTLGSITLTLGNIIQSNAQVIQAQTTHNLNLRTGTSANSSIILNLKKGTTVEIVESLGAWSKVKYKNHLGYVSSQYLKRFLSEENPLENEKNIQCTKVKIMECDVNLSKIRFGPSNSETIIGTLKKGDKIEVLYEVNSAWARVRYNGGHGYVSLLHFTESNSNNVTNTPTTIYCNASTLNIRKGPSSSEKIVGNLKKNDLVEVIYHINTGWTKIKYANGYAYVNTNYLIAI